jgi:type I restriction enzyme S subunit
MTKSSLPKGWRLVKFGDLVRKVSNRVDPDLSGISRYVAGEHMDSDNLSITRWGVVGDGYLGPAFTMRFEPGQVLYGSRRTYLRKVALADFEGICANTTFVLETKSDDLLQEFLPHVMSTERFHEHSISKSKGSVNPYINFVDLNDYEFLLPPITEQNRIVKALEKVDEAVQLSMASNTNDLMVALVHSLFVNENYTKCQLADFSEISIGGIWGAAIGEDEMDVEIVRQTEFCDNATIAIGSGEVRSISKAQLSKRQLMKGDILIQKSAGTPTLCGRVVRVASIIEEPVVCSNFLHMFRVQGSADVADFVFWSLWYLHRVGKVFDLQRGTSIRNLDMGRYLKLMLPSLPASDLKEFVIKIRSIINLESQIESMQINLKISAQVLREHVMAGKNV